MSKLQWSASAQGPEVKLMPVVSFAAHRPGETRDSAPSPVSQ
jgi:hypothetical protein